MATIYTKRRNAQLLGVVVVFIGTICVGIAERFQNHTAFVPILSLGIVVLGLGVGVMVLTSRCPVCNLPVNYVLMALERHECCGSCWQKKRMNMEPQHGVSPYRR